MTSYYLYTGGYTEPAQMASGEVVPGRCCGIGCYALDGETGALTRLAVTPSTPNPSHLTLSPDGRFLYCVNELKDYEGVPGSTASAYAVEENGALRLLSRQFTCGADACFAALTPDGAQLLLANYSGGSVCALPVLPDGGLGHAACVLRHSGHGADPARQQGPHPHQILFAPDGRHVYVSDLGLDRLVCYRMDGETGWLVRDGWPDICGVPGQGVRHGVFAASKRHLYVMTEMACELNVYGYDPVTGAASLLQRLSALEEGCRTPGLGAAIRLHPNGRLLYCSVRGSDQIVVFRMLDDGRLELLRHEPCGGKIPRDFLLTPDGRFLLVGNQDSDTVCVFAADGESGALTPVWTQEAVGAVTVLALAER